MATVLPRYLTTTLILMLGVAVLTAAMGTGAAWLVTHVPLSGPALAGRRCCFRWRSRPMSGPMRWST
jgi:ABC-type Fe3+ transport system permease subunit